MENNLMTLPFNTKCWVGIIDEAKSFIKKVVRESVEEVVAEKIATQTFEDQRLSAQELCERWNISRSTLYNWEVVGKISPLPLGGRKRVYSMRDVLEAEANGFLKTAI